MIKTLNGQIYDATEIDNKTTELETRIEKIVIAGGGVDPTVFQETVDRLDAEDTTLKSRVTELETGSTAFNERLTVLEETGDAVPSATFNEAINRLDAEDAAIKDRLTELETREPGTDPSEPSEDSTGCFTFTGEYILDDEGIYVASVNMDALDSAAFTDALNTDKAFKLYLRSSATMIDLVVTDYLISKQGENYVVMFNLKQLGLESTLSCTVQIPVMYNTETSTYTYGSIDIYRDEPSTPDEPSEDNTSCNTLSVPLILKNDDGFENIESFDLQLDMPFDDFMTKAKDPSTLVHVSFGYYAGEAYIAAFEGVTNMRQCVTDTTNGIPAILLTGSISLAAGMQTGFTLTLRPDDLGKVSIDLEGSAIHIPEEEPSEPSEEADSTYTYVIDSQEKFDAFCVATNATTPDGNDYSHVYIKNGDYTIIDGHGIRLDNEVVPVLSITGESQEGVVIDTQATYAFYCINENTADYKFTSFTLKQAVTNSLYAFYNLCNTTLYHVTVDATVKHELPSPQTSSYLVCAIWDNCICNATDCTFNYVDCKHYTQTGNVKLFITDSTILMSNAGSIGDQQDVVYTNCDISADATSFEAAKLTDCNITFNIVPKATSIPYSNIKAFEINTCVININYEINTSSSAFTCIYTSTLCNTKIIATFTKSATLTSTTNDTDIKLCNVRKHVENCVLCIDLRALINDDSSFFVPRLTGIYATDYTGVRATITDTTVLFSVPQKLVPVYTDTSSSALNVPLLPIKSALATKSPLVGITEAKQVSGCVVINSTCGYNKCYTLNDCYSTPLCLGTSGQDYTVAEPTENVYVVGYSNCTNLTNCVCTDNYSVAEKRKDTHDLGNTTFYYTNRFLAHTSESEEVSTTTYTVYATLNGFKGCDTLINCVFDLASFYVKSSTYAIDIKGYDTCTNTIACAAAIDALHFAYTYVIYKPNTTGNTTSHSINYIAFNKCTNVQGCNRPKHTLVVTATNKTPSDTVCIIPVFVTYYNNCNNIVNCSYAQNVTQTSYTGDYTKTTATSGHMFGSMSQHTVSHYYVSFDTCSRVSNCQSGWSSSGAFSEVKTTTGMHNCILKNASTATCSASQTYVADYAIADTPAGGFNKIVS